MKSKRNPHGQFLPGSSGNPGGRPKRHAFSELARQCTREAIETCLDVMRSGNRDTDRLRAAETVLAYAWGKPDTTKDSYDLEKSVKLDSDFSFSE